MPELPEVFAAVKLLNKHCVGKQIKHASFLECGGGPRQGMFDDIICKNDQDYNAATLSKMFIGRTLKSVQRKGKYMWWNLDDVTYSPVIHFGMTGSFIIKDVGHMTYKSFSVDSKNWPPKYSKCSFVLDDGMEFALVDARRLSKFKVITGDPTSQLPLKKLANDPLIDMPSVEFFETKGGKKAASLKAILLDQSCLISGIGNWMADEVCYQSQVFPGKPGKDISHDEWSRIHFQVKEISEIACKVEGKSTEFPPDWMFHSRWGRSKVKTRTATTKKGEKIYFEKIGGRTTAYVKFSNPSDLNDETSNDTPMKELKSKKVKSTNTTNGGTSTSKVAEKGKGTVKEEEKIMVKKEERTPIKRKMNNATKKTANKKLKKEASKMKMERNKDKKESKMIKEEATESSTATSMRRKLRSHGKIGM